jgi:hypothetical protein
LLGQRPYPPTATAAAGAQLNRLQQFARNKQQRTAQNQKANTERPQHSNNYSTPAHTLQGAQHTIDVKDAQLLQQVPLAGGV